MLTASFPPGNLGWLAWIAFIPLLKAIETESLSESFRLGFVAGLANYLTLIYWLALVFKGYGGLNIILSLSILVLICFYFAIYPAVFSLLSHYLKNSPYRILGTAGIWITLEFLRGKLFTGLPWCLLGYSQFEELSLIQISDLVGVYGISFIIMAVNILLYIILSRSLRYTFRHHKIEILITVLILVSAFIYGEKRIAEYNRENKAQKTVKIAVIQGNIDQAVKWDLEYQEDTLNLYHRLTSSTYDFTPDLIIWPETAAPFFFQDGTEHSRKIMDIAKESSAHTIFGSPAYKLMQDGTNYYNRVYLVSPDGFVTDYYDKVHLVPFGEYVPLKAFIPFIRILAQAAGDFVPGEKIAPVKVPDLSAGVLICYEAIFPELSRIQVQKGSEILVNVTNDAWFGMTSAPYHHLAMTVFRAVENKRHLIRSANTGFSAFIRPDGSMISHGGLFTEEVLMHEVKISNLSLTFYSRYGDIFIYTVSIISLIFFLKLLFYHLFKKNNRETVGPLQNLESTISSIEFH
ncbi:apolipoprotein N-acyltransferase [Thermodesulfobacteriota bacterium]